MRKRILKRGATVVLSAMVAASIVPSGAVTAFAADNNTTAQTTTQDSSSSTIQFSDVTDPEKFYYEPIYWMASENITTGWQEKDGTYTFRPMNTINRAAVVTFLWRMAGEPEATKEAEFTDMTGNDDFNKAISWASEQGITTGYKDGTFRPWADCNRAAIVTFLWRYAGEPEAAVKAEFKDMTTDDNFNKAISWASETGITTGFDGNLFKPWDTCKRLAMASFLYRFEQLSSVTSWVDLYNSMGVNASAGEGYYDAVTSATIFTSRHAKDIPAIVNRVEDAEGATTALDGVNLTGKEATVEVKLASASHSVYGPDTAAGKKYGSEEFIIYPDDTVEGYVWNEYLANVYAVTISNGETTVGALPWVDFYGESATSGFHYNKLEIALNNGTSEAANEAIVNRYKAFYDGDNLKSGVYTVTVYSEGYTPLTAKISTGKIAVADVTTDATEIEVSGADTLGFTPSYQLDSNDVTYKDGKIAVSDLAIGPHTLTAIDAAGEISSVSTTFTASTTKVMAAYDASKESLIAADDVTADEFSAYLSAISKVTVNGTSYNTTGRGAVTVIGTDGSIDLSNTVAADSTEDVDISVEATGYPDLTFTMAQEKGYYVLMNIPYDEFYAAEGVAGVDTVTTATVKTYNQTMAGGSYHSGSLSVTNPDTDDPLDNAEILGITYPVYVEDLAVLDSAKEVTDESTATITVASGKSARTTKEVTGTDVLFASGDYAYYVLTEAPESYKTLSANEDGSFAFSAASKEAESATFSEAALTYGGHYTDITFSVADADNINGTVNAITITADGTKYALRHVEDIWRLTELGWNWNSLDGKGLSGKTITNVTYYVKNESGEYGVYSYDVNIAVKTNPGEISAKFSDENTIALTGLPEDIASAKATVKSKVGRGETAVVIAEDVDVKDGVITTTDAAVAGTTYTITVISDNYADVSAEAEYTIE